jgi:hypothetical protein
MSELNRYRRRPGAEITAIQIDLDTDGFSYRKWGATQACKRGDWLVDNGGDIYTVDQEVFASTYRAVGPGRYAKATAVWAEVAKAPGVIETKEGATHYQAGDYLVYNAPERGDGYAVKPEKFRELYEPAESDKSG